jgi:hypothetical protein
MENNEKSIMDMKIVTGAGEAAKERPNKPAEESETTKKKKLTPMQELARTFKAFSQKHYPDLVGQIISPFEKEEIPDDVPVSHYEGCDSYSRKVEEK